MRKLRLRSTYAKRKKNCPWFHWKLILSQIETQSETLKQAQPLLILRPGGFQQHWMHPGPAKNYHRLPPPPRLLIELGWRAAWALGFTSKFSRQLSHAAKLRDHHLPPGWVCHPLCRPMRHWLTTTARQMCAAALLSTLASKGHTPVCQKTGDLWYLHLL